MSDILPAELLDEVFGYALGRTPGSWFGDPSPAWFTDPSDWLCFVDGRRWRERMYNNPAWWRFIYFVRYLPPRFMEFCVMQTKNGMFNVHIDSSAYAGVPRKTWGKPRAHIDPLNADNLLMDVFSTLIESIVGSNIHRVERIRVEGAVCPDWETILKPLLACDAPALRFAEFSVRALEPTRYATQQLVLDHLAWGKLEYFGTYGISPVWLGIGALPRLTNLVLQCGWALRMQVPDLLSALEAAPALVELSLDDVECVDREEGRIVTLAYLRAFRFSYSCAACCLVLPRLQMPSLDYLLLEAHPTSPSDALWRSCGHLLSTVTELHVWVSESAAAGISALWLGLRRVVHLDLNVDEQIWVELWDMVCTRRVLFPGIQYLRLQDRKSPAAPQDIIREFRAGGETPMVVVLPDFYSTECDDWKRWELTDAGLRSKRVGGRYGAWSDMSRTRSWDAVREVLRRL
ncbi:hypothetical protein B0H16DRAFT_1466765 [Mycena metata]|uniref:Uncharacterized protein n=1 Tax=Mycena metata TaxID=1033252 RepID=A0AAD7I6R3_9AGAR|nr:hypothetical protein B0H16DRAFT_1466765 [Mycena metata]